MAVRSPDAWMDNVLRSAAEWPIIETLLPVNLWNQGIGNCVIARQLPDGRVAFANILVDAFCLGVKDAFCKIVSLVQYRNLKAEVENVGRLKAVPPEQFAKFIFDAIDYAANIGFEPHRDFYPAELLLEGIDTSACTEQFEFGQNGKPFYIQGPNDSPSRVAAIMSRVQAVGGHFVMMVGRSSHGMPDELADEMDDEE